MHAAFRVLGWSLLIAGLIGVLWPERPEAPGGFAELPFDVAAAEAPARAPPQRPPGGGCPTPTCALFSDAVNLRPALLR